MKIIPTQNIVVIKRDKSFHPDQKPGSLIILPPSTLNPDNRLFQIRRGVIQSVGPGKMSPKGRFIPTTLKPGLTVIYPSTQAAEIFDPPDITYDLVPEHEIPAIIED